MRVYLVLGGLLLSTPSIGQTISYVYPTTGRPHAPVADTYYQYSYDANGNMTQITHPQKTVSFAYNHLNKLKETRDGAIVTRYAYDTNGTRIAKLINGEVSERYFGPIEKKNNQIITYYFVGGKRVAEKSESGQMSYYHQDHLGSTSLVTNASGNEIRWTDYYEFGAVRTERGPKDVDYMYNDKRRDKETDFYDYGARAYAAKMFKFTTPDSIVPDPANPQSFNRYAYTRNNPLKYVDPTGHAEVPVADPSMPAEAPEMGPPSGFLEGYKNVMDDVAEFAPGGSNDLISPILGQLVQGAANDLKLWFGGSVDDWAHGIGEVMGGLGAMGPELAALGGGGRATSIADDLSPEAAAWLQRQARSADLEIIARQGEEAAMGTIIREGQTAHKIGNPAHLKFYQLEAKGGEIAERIGVPVAKLTDINVENGVLHAQKPFIEGTRLDKVSLTPGEEIRIKGYMKALIAKGILPDIRLLKNWIMTPQREMVCVDCMALPKTH